MNSEEAFLFATFKEFHKCWRSGTKARVIIESVNGKAFVNFSAFLGDPYDAHFKPRPSKRNPSNSPRKKSSNKISRDNHRAAQFQARKRREKEEASACTPADNPECEAIASSTAPVTDSSSTSTPSKEFKFSDPTRENMSGPDCSDIMNLDGNVTLSEMSQDVEEASPNTQENAELETSVSQPLEPHLTALVQGALLGRLHWFELSRRFPEKPKQKDYKAFKERKLLAKKAMKELELELRNLIIPTRTQREIIQHVEEVGNQWGAYKYEHLSNQEASSIEDAVHGVEDILQRYYDEKPTKSTL